MRSHARAAAAVALLCLMLSCGGGTSANVEDYSTREVTLPNGKVIKAEVMINTEDMMRGMMFRDSLAENRGMLFVHSTEGKYAYWMYQVKIPLDIIWMDSSRHVVEISANTPPCRSTSPKECPSYGGTQPARYVLELSGGGAARNTIKVGAAISF